MTTKRNIVCWLSALALMLGAAACGSYQPTGTPTDKPLGEAATGKRVFDQAQARNKLVVESTEAAKAAAEDDDTSTPLSAAPRKKETP